MTVSLYTPSTNKLKSPSPMPVLLQPFCPLNPFHMPLIALLIMVLQCYVGDLQIPATHANLGYPKLLYTGPAAERCYFSIHQMFLPQLSPRSEVEIGILRLLLTSCSTSNLLTTNTCSNRDSPGNLNGVLDWKANIQARSTAKYDPEFRHARFLVLLRGEGLRNPCHGRWCV